MSYLQTRDGVDLYYKDWGEGRPVVLIHGWPLDADMWDVQANTLADRGFRVVSYDRRGFGRSSQPGTGYNYDTLADDLAQLMEKLELRDAVLVGFSMGGGEVARYLSRHGTERVGRAVLVSSVLPYLLQDDTNPDGVDGSVFAGLAGEIEKDRPNFLATFGRQFYGAGFLSFTVSPDTLAWTQQMALLASHRATLACLKAFSTTDFRPDMASFTVPTLVIHGSGDQTVPFEASAEKAARMIPNCRLEIYEGAPHGLHHTDQDRLADDLAGFARE